MTRRGKRKRGAPKPRWEVISDADRAYAYILTHYPLARTAQMKGLCQLRDGEVVAAVVYDTFSTHNCFMHVAAEPGRRWLTRHALHETFKYPFITAGCSRVTCWVEETNRDSRNFVRSLGFQPEAVLQKAGNDGVDVLIYRMFRQECRYA